MEWTPLLRDFGIFGGLVVFFVWTTWQRSKATEEFVRETLVELIVRSNEVMQRHTEVMQELHEKISSCPTREDK